MRPFIALSLLIATAGCDSDFDPSSRITDLRLLAVRADLPFARPGERVTLEALAVDVDDRPFNLAWSTCTRPSSTTAAGCLDALDASAPLVQGAGLLSHELTVPADILDGVSSEAAALINVGAVQVLCPGRVEREAGPENLPLRCLDESGTPLPLGTYEVGVKRIYVRATDRNVNPVIAEIRFDGQPWPEGEIKQAIACADADENRFDRCEGPAYELEARISSDSIERGVDELGVAFTETLIAQYYATEGLFEYEVKDARSPVTRYKPRAGTIGRIVTFWFVVRDDRGGVSWTSRELEVAGP